MKIKVKAYAKINLMLDIVAQRKDGYHDLFMIMQLLLKKQKAKRLLSLATKKVFRLMKKTLRTKLPMRFSKRKISKIQASILI